MRMTEKGKKTLFTVLRLLIGTAVIVVLLLMTDFKQVGELIGKLHPIHLLAAIMLYVVDGLLLAYRWRILLRAQGIRISYFKVMCLQFLGMFYNNFLFSSIGGDLLRGWYVTAYSHKKVESVFSVVVDRITGTVGLLILCVIGLLMVNKELLNLGYSDEVAGDAGSGVGTHLSGTTMLLGGIVLLIAVLVLGFVLRNRIRAEVLKVKEYLARIAAAIRIYASKPRYLVKAVLVSMLAQLLCIYGLYMVGHGLGIDASFKYYLGFLPLSWAVASLPVSPGGLGVMEAGVTAMFAALPQVSIEQALMIAMAQRVMLVGGSLGGIFVHLGGLHLPE